MTDFGNCYVKGILWLINVQALLLQYVLNLVHKNYCTLLRPKSFLTTILRPSFVRVKTIISEQKSINFLGNGHSKRPNWVYKTTQWTWTRQNVVYLLDLCCVLSRFISMLQSGPKWEWEMEIEQLVWQPPCPCRRNWEKIDHYRTFLEASKRDDDVLMLERSGAKPASEMMGVSSICYYNL